MLLSLGHNLAWEPKPDGARALALLEEATKLFPDSAMARFYLGYALGVQMGDWRRAVPALRDAILLEPRLAGAHGYLGLALAVLSWPEMPRRRWTRP